MWEKVKFCQDRERQSEFYGQLGKHYQRSTISFKATTKLPLKNWSNLMLSCLKKVVMVSV